MAVLGTGGKLVLKRTAPDACIIGVEHLDPVDNLLTDICKGYWTGDHVAVIGLPIYVGGVPVKPSGYGCYYGSAFHLGPNRDHVTSRTDQYYKQAGEEFPDGQAGDAADFYAKINDVFNDGDDKIPPDPEDDYWIHVNELGYVSFYTNRCAAMRGCPRDRVDLANVGGNIAVGPYGSAIYNNAIAECYADWGRYANSDVLGDNGLSECINMPVFTAPGTNDYDNAEISLDLNSHAKGYVWEILCDIRGWELQLEAPNVDVTSVSEKFGNSVKSLVRGGGNVEFFIDRDCYEDGQNNGIPLMELLLMTEKGCKASAQFWMIDRGKNCDTADRQCGKLAGDLYYECDILVTRSSVNIRPTELVVGTAQFVTTDEIRLLQEPYNRPYCSD